MLIYDLRSKIMCFINPINKELKINKDDQNMFNEFIDIEKYYNNHISIFLNLGEQGI